MRANTYTPCALSKHRDPRPISSKPPNKLLNPEQCIPLIVERKIHVPFLRRMQISQRAEPVLDTRAYNGLIVKDGLLDHERGAVLFVDFAEDEAAAVDVDQDWEFGGGKTLQDGQGDVEL